MKKPDPKDRYLDDWDSKLTDDWIKHAQIMQGSHCQNIGGHEKGVRFTKDLFYKIDDLILMHAFGMSAKEGPQRSNIKANFNSAQRKAAQKVRKQIVKCGKITDVKNGETSVTLQIIAVTLMIVDIPEENKEKPNKNPIPGLAQIVVFRVVKPDNKYCFVDQTPRVYSDWDDYLKNNNVPRAKMCYPRNGEYKFHKLSNGSSDENNNDRPCGLDLELSESVSCTDWERFKSKSLQVVSYISRAAAVVSIVALPFTGGAAPNVYAILAQTISGYISAGCICISIIANAGSLVDKYKHHQSFYTEVGDILMTILTVGVSQYNKGILTKVKTGIEVTRTQLIMMTVLNCFKFGVDTVTFAATLTNLVAKLIKEGRESITAMELVQFCKDAYFYGKCLISPKTGYGIILETQRRYLMIEKAAKITDPEASTIYRNFVNPDNRLGDDTIGQKMKDDWKGFFCSQQVCDELNKNGAVIQNINAFNDLNQFFLEVRDTNTMLRMTNAGNMMVNEELEAHGRKLNEVGTSVNGINEHRRNLLQLTAGYHAGILDPNQNQAQNRATYDAGLIAGNYKFGNDRLFFEVDRIVLQATFGAVRINNQPVFENMSLGVADRLWRVIWPMGRHGNDVMAAAKTIAENMNDTDPRQFADIMEFVYFKRNEFPNDAERSAFLAGVADPTTAVFTQTITELRNAVRAAEQILATADTPWTSATAAAYHYFKHKDDVPPNNAQQQPAEGAVNDFDRLRANMARYLNEQWRNVVRPANQTFEGHSQDGRTYRKSYSLNIPDDGPHLAFTSSDADNRDKIKIMSHYIARN